MTMGRIHSFLCACWIALPVAGLGQEPAPAPAPPATRPPAAVEAGSSGFSLADAEGDFKLRLRALIQTDGRFYSGDEAPSTDGFLVRRARIELTGTVFESFDFRLMPDFAGSETTLLDAWLRWKISPALQVQVGKVKLPIGLERAQSREHNLFNELGYPTALVPNRDIGINLQGDLGDARTSYFVGVFGGAADGARVVTDSDDHREVAARLFSTPLDGLGIGLAGTYGTREGTAPSSYRTVGQQTFFRWRDGVVDDGTTWRAVPQLYFHRGPFLALAEYARVSHELRLEGTAEEIEASAWTASASWVLTGEKATFGGVTWTIPSAEAPAAGAPGRSWPARPGWRSPTKPSPASPIRPGRRRRRRRTAWESTGMRIASSAGPPTTITPSSTAARSRKRRCSSFEPSFASDRCSPDFPDEPSG